jgi:hypothetical protein
MLAVLIEVDVTGIEREADSRVYASKSCPPSASSQDFSPARGSPATRAAAPSR